MANHFRKPEEGQDEVSTPSAEPVAASHFALSTDSDAVADTAAGVATAPTDAADSGFSAQPAVNPMVGGAAAPSPDDTGAFLASAGVSIPAALNVPEMSAIPEVRQLI